MTRKRHRILRPADTWHFSKGHEPFNKGQSFIAGGRSAQTQFKNGSIPHNTKQDGCISIRKDKTGRLYKWIRISKANWKMLHVKIWEDKNGKVPNGKIIVFADKNSMDVTLKNLICITRQEHLKRNWNREKMAKSLRSSWAIVKTFEDFGLTPPYKFRSKRKKIA